MENEDELLAQLIDEEEDLDTLFDNDDLEDESEEGFREEQARREEYELGMMEREQQGNREGSC